MILLNLIWYFKSHGLQLGFASVHSSRRASGYSLLPRVSMTGWVNAFLVVSLLSLFAYYILATTKVTAGEYSIKVLAERLQSTQNINGTLVAEQGNIDANSDLLNFAQSRNMVESRDGLHLVERGGVALR